jgi:hypothetical protein
MPPPFAATCWHDGALSCRGAGRCRHVAPGGRVGRHASGWSAASACRRLSSAARISCDARSCSPTATRFNDINPGVASVVSQQQTHSQHFRNVREVAQPPADVKPSADLAWDHGERLGIRAL